MKITKLLGMALGFATAILAVPDAQAAPTFVGVGSSAMFQTFAITAVTTAGVPGGSCGDQIWSRKGGNTNSPKLHDPRPGVADENGDAWIVWNSVTLESCLYLSVDSVVGDRAYFAAPRATITFPAGTCNVDQPLVDTLVPAVLVGGSTTYAPLPAGICASLNGATVTAAMSDIRAEDALFATRRILATIPSGGLGYGPGNIGSPILSAQSTKSAKAVNFAMTGTDPITGAPVPAFTTYDIGGAPILVVLNKGIGGGPLSGNLGSTVDGTSTGAPIFTNVNRFSLAAAFDGSLVRTRDLINNDRRNIMAEVGLKTFIREPLSGTMNTFEYDVPSSKNVASSQEDGFAPRACNGNGAPGHNPCDYSGTVAGTPWRRSRVIGTGEMVSTTNTTGNSIGYSFWSYGNFASTPNLRYLAVDGVDPVQPAYTDGTIPTCATAPCLPVTFDHVADGSYPIWALLHVIADPADLKVQDLVNKAQNDAASVSDFIPADCGLVAPGSPCMTVFRDHYDLVLGGVTVISAKNGHVPAGSSAGREAGGAVLGIQFDYDYAADNSVEILQKRQ